jgi:molybdopterin molybdotransferase
VRDGFAIRASDSPGVLRVIGEVRAGGKFSGAVGFGEAVEIMTGAPVPDGADAIVMVEHVERDGARVRVPHAEAKQFINFQGCEACVDEVVLHAGQRLDYTGIAMLASVGRRKVKVCRKPVVSIVATGDEIVAVEDKPAKHQIRNSNAFSLAAQVTRAGGNPRILPVAKDTVEDTEQAIGNGLRSDMLLLSGGVSAGKYDVVEEALASFGARIYFDRVLIQPGQPLVFGSVGEKYFFGLPGNPSSTMVTFEIFARAALELLGGQNDVALAMPHAKLTHEFRHRPGITRFLPARLSPDGAEVTPLQWKGSGDVPALTRANVYLVADANKPEYDVGEWIRVLAK